MITDINNEPIVPGSYKYKLKGWSRSIRVTVYDWGDELYVRKRRKAHPIRLIDVSEHAIFERIDSLFFWERI